MDEAIAQRDGALEVVGETLAAAEAKFEEQTAEIEARGADLARQRRLVEDLERLTSRLSERVVERERELRQVRHELARAREESDARIQMLDGLQRELEAVRGQARAQATRIRLRALREAAELADGMETVGRRPPEARGMLVEALAEAIGRIGVEPGDLESEAGGDADRWAPEEVFEGLVEVEIGPLTDFSQLVGFEDAAKSIRATSRISVKRFSEGRATLAVALAEPVALLRELEERCDLEFVVRDVRRDRLVLDVGE